MLIAFGADTILRAEGSGSTLDQAFADFYARFASRGAGYSVADVRDFFDEIHPSLGARVYREATEVAGLDIAGLLVGWASGLPTRRCPIWDSCLPTTPVRLSTGCWIQSGRREASPLRLSRPD